MRTLTRQEARERASLLDVASYDVHLDLSEELSFSSVTEVRFSCRTPGASTFLELDGEVLQVERAGRSGPPRVEGNRILLDDLAESEAVRVTARCATTRTGEGLHRAVDPADGEVYLYAQAFLDDAQRLFACFDQPDLKAVFRLRVTAPERWRVLGNTRAAREGRTWVFAPTPRLPTYLVTLAAGPWEGRQKEYVPAGEPDRAPVQLGVWCRRSLLPHLEADELLRTTRDCLAYQERVFGRAYPFGDCYDQVFVPEFNAGAMENPGMVTFSDERFVFRSRTTTGQRRLRAQVIAHEMAHMWFGDLVTMRWWDDLWLNESFAELLGVHTVENALVPAGWPFQGAYADFCLGRKAWGYRADQLPTTHPVSGEVPDTRAALLNFDGISYAKGASALRQLSAWLGEEVFLDGVRRYLDRHAWGSTELGDLLRALEQASGRDLSGWARAWLQTSGVGVLRVEAGSLVQDGPVLRPHRVGVGLYELDGADGPLRRTARVEVELTGARTPLAGADGSGIAPADLERADLVLPNDGDLTFAKVRLDPRSAATALRATGRLADPLSRALVWGALVDATRDGELPAADLAAAVLAGVGAESDPEVVGTLLGSARTAARLYAPDDGTGARLLAALHAHSVAAADAAAAGSDLQLVHVRAAADAATAPDLLTRWLDGSALPAGVQLDADLRWHLLGRLAALGAADERRVRAELDRDRTASGEQQAARALASRPDAAAKAAVWDELLGEGELSNGRARALGQGFWQPGQERVLRPYADRYAAEVALLWERRTPALAPTVARLLFPRTLVEPAVLELTAPLAEPDRPAGLRRVVLEERDELARALRARRRASPPA